MQQFARRDSPDTESDTPADNKIVYFGDTTLAASRGNGQVQIAPVAVPEPAMFALLGVGAAAALMKRRQRGGFACENFKGF